MVRLGRREALAGVICLLLDEDGILEISTMSVEQVLEAEETVLALGDQLQVLGEVALTEPFVHLHLIEGALIDAVGVEVPPEVGLLPGRELEGVGWVQVGVDLGDLRL